jgi:hypothetical protein
MFVLGRLSTRTVDPGGKTAADTNWPIPFDTVIVQVKGATAVVALLTRLFVLTADSTGDVTVTMFEGQVVPGPLVGAATTQAFE